MVKSRMLNTYVNNITLQETLTTVEQMIQDNKKAYVVAVNVDVIIKIEQDDYLKKIVDEADIVLTDGKPLIWISKLHKRPVKEKVSGSDLVPSLCALSAEKKYTVFILGGREGIAEKARQQLEKTYPDIRIVGTYAPRFGFEQDEKELDKINGLISEAHPELLIVCLGCPKQEKYIYENYQKYNAKVSICAGATVDFLAGNVKRAPQWVSELGFEWFYRFLQEPKRMFKRYFIDDMKVIRLMWKYR